MEAMKLSRYAAQNTVHNREFDYSKKALMPTLWRSVARTCWCQHVALGLFMGNYRYPLGSPAVIL